MTRTMYITQFEPDIYPFIPPTDFVYRSSIMLSTIIPLLLATLVTASPLIKRQSGLQVVENCINQGQVALTFDGTSSVLPPHSSPSHVACRYK
jgi:hypothetical protein